MSKGSWSNAFPSLTTTASLFNIGRNLYRYNRGYGSYFLNPGSDEKKMVFKSRKRFRGRTRTITRRRNGKFRRGRRLIKRIKRISRTMHRKGLSSVEIKYAQGADATTRALNGVNVLYGVSERTFNANPNSNPFSVKVSPTAGIARGTTRENRIGNKIFIRHLRIKGGIWASTNAKAANEVYIKFMVIRVKEAQGSPTTAVTSIPTADNVFDVVNPAGTRFDGSGVVTNFTLGADAQSKIMANFANEWKFLHSRWGNDFQVLKRKTWKVSKETGVNAEKKFFKINIPIFKPAHWDDADNPQDGHIYIYYWVDSFTQDPNLDRLDADFNNCRPSMGWTYRVSYTDV